MNLGVNLKVERLNLKNMIEKRNDRIILVIGISNGFEARQLHHSIYELYNKKLVPDYVGGFVYFVSGYLCSAMNGLPDMGLILRTEIAQQTNIIEQASWFAAADTGKAAFPIGVDIDTGYGNEPSSVLLTCRQVHKQGAQYLQIEDQLNINKTCGHMNGSRGTGKEVISAEEMISLRITPALTYSKQQKDLLIMARTDSVSTMGFEEGLRRVHLYADSGADMVFIEALENDNQLAIAAREFLNSDILIMANMIEGSIKTPYKSPRELHRLGYGIAIYPIGPMLAGREAIQKYYGIIGKGESIIKDEGMHTENWFDGFNTIIGRDQTEMVNRYFHSLLNIS